MMVVSLMDFLLRFSFLRIDFGGSENLGWQDLVAFYSRHFSDVG